MRYRPEIDGLRAVAVLPVILFHAGYGPFSGGYVGVDVFFVISGYLITSLIARDLAAGCFSLADFYERRARRILPALFTVALACLPFAWLYLFPEHMVDFAQSLWGVATFSSNFVFWMQADYFDSAAELKPLLHTWSLAVEEQYYILFPLIMLVLWRAGPRWVLIVLAGFFVASLIGAQVGSAMDPDFTFYMLPTRAWELAAGAMTAMVLRHREAPFGPRAGAAIALAGLAAIVLPVGLYGPDTPFPGVYALPPVLGTVAIIVFARPGTLPHRLLSLRPLVGIGLISYSAYLWHQPAFAFARHAGIDGRPATMPALILLSLGLAWATWRWIETPARSRRRLPLPALTAPLGICVACIAGFSVLALRSDGNLGRYTPWQFHLVGAAGDYEDFIWKDHHESRGKPFVRPGAVHVLLIGDSGSADLLNALRRMPSAPEYEFSTLKISKGCGNLYLPRDGKRRLAGPAWRPICRDSDDYDSPASRALLQSADIVILASAWLDWETPLVEPSIARLEAEYGPKFRVFGSKRLADDIPEIVRDNGFDLSAYRVKPDPLDQRINARLAGDLGGAFIDPFALFCTPRGCPILDEKGQPLIYDGFHLTKAGADWFGHLFERQGILSVE